MKTGIAKHKQRKVYVAQNISLNILTVVFSTPKATNILHFYSDRCGS